MSSEIIIVIFFTFITNYCILFFGGRGKWSPTSTTTTKSSLFNTRFVIELWISVVWKFLFLGQSAGIFYQLSIRLCVYGFCCKNVNVIHWWSTLCNWNDGQKKTEKCNWNKSLSYLFLFNWEQQQKLNNILQ